MPSRSNTRIGEAIEANAAPTQKKAVSTVCNIMNKLFLRKMDEIADLARNRYPEELLRATTDFRSLWYLMAGMCHDIKFQRPKE